MPVSLGRGLYTFSEAARFTKLNTPRVREWFRRPQQNAAKKPLFVSDYEPVEGSYAISFHDLIDVYVAGHLREQGISLQHIRKVYAKLKHDFHTDHAFCRQELLHDGKIIFVRGLDDKGRDQVMEVLTRQHVFKQILLPFLKTIDYETSIARRWRIAESVVIDPSICHGSPIVEGASIPTYILAAAYHANSEDAERVATWHGVTPENVLAAVKFENRFAA